MKFAIIDTVYPGYVEWLYRDNDLAAKSYAEQYAATIGGGFPTLSAWAEPLRQHGHDVLDIWANQIPMQARWCFENDAIDCLVHHADAITLGGRTVQLGNSGSNGFPAHVHIVMEQIRRFAPDVLLIGYLHDFDARFLREVAQHYRLAIGQHAAPLPECDFTGFDVIISSLPNQVSFFRHHGVPSQLVRLAFDIRIMDQLSVSDPHYDLVFAGQLDPDHLQRTETLLALGRSIPIDIFGSARWDNAALADTRITLHPAQWGTEMYRTMAEARIVFNRHIDAAGVYANNLRLYEASGCGSLLLTDFKVNLPEILAPGIECATYRDLDECVAKAQYFLSHEDERRKIAEAGRARVRREHTYFHRVSELLDIVELLID